MRINDLLYENEADHHEAMEETGYWGRQGAGCIFHASSTNRFCIFHRSREVLEPGTWGGVGGAIDEGENPEQAVRREVIEETGFNDRIRFTAFYVYQDKAFRYTNFVGHVSEEFHPRLNWENQGFRWVELGEWPTPLHPGLIKAFADSNAQEILRKIASR